MDKLVSVVGLGYLGLTMSAVFAQKMRVIGIDSDMDRISCLKQGKCPIFEPKLAELLIKNRQKIEFSDNILDSIGKAEIVFLAVGTANLKDNSQDISGIVKTVEAVAKSANKRGKTFLVIRSTILPKTTETIIIPIIRKYLGVNFGVNFHVCVNPEFGMEGKAIENIQNPDKIVLGSSSTYAIERLREFYKQFYEDKEIPVISTNFVNAELIKYSQNAFLSTKISFINQVANVCEKTPGSDVEVIAKAIGLDKRVSPFFLKAGAGFGGGCLPKDLKCFRKYADESGTRVPLLDAVDIVNTNRPSHIVDIAEKALEGLKGKRIAVLGLSFKPETDDLREAPSLRIIESLLQQEASVVVYDPKAMEKAKQIFTDRITYAISSSECLKFADCCIIATEWREFQEITQETFSTLMKKPVIIDGRRVLNKESYTNTDFYAIGLGRTGPVTIQGERKT